MARTLSPTSPSQAPAPAAASAQPKTAAAAKAKASTPSEKDPDTSSVLPGNPYYPRYGSLQERMLGMWLNLGDYIQKLNGKYQLAALKAEQHLKAAIAGVGHFGRGRVDLAREFIDLPDLMEHQQDKPDNRASQIAENTLRKMEESARAVHGPQTDAPTTPQDNS